MLHSDNSIIAVMIFIHSDDCETVRQASSLSIVQSYPKIVKLKNKREEKIWKLSHRPTVLYDTYKKYFRLRPI